MSIKTDIELRALWRGNGGEFDQPYLETGSMPASKLLPLLRDLIREASDAREDSENHKRVAESLRTQLASVQSCAVSMAETLRRIGDPKFIYSSDEDDEDAQISARMSDARVALKLYTTRHEVMNPPASAARGAEARNLNSANVMGLGEVHRASEARPADDVPAPCCVMPRIVMDPRGHYCGNCGRASPPLPEKQCGHDPMKPDCTLMHQFNQPGRTTCTVCNGTFWLPITTAQKLPGAQS